MTVLGLTGAGLRYDDRRALDGVSATLQGGALTALCGPNGAGKSSLLRLAAGLAAPSEGSVRLDGEPLAMMDPKRRARRIAYLPADARATWPMTARRIVALGRIPHLKPLRRLGDADEAAIDAALERAGATPLADRVFDSLSSGERARVLIARTLATEARIILMDEPTATLDPRFQLEVMALLKAEAGRGALVLFAAHALELVAGHADRVLLLKKGILAADGSPEEALSEARMAEVFGVAAPGGVRAAPFSLPA